ncbi:MAG: DNA-3-methyladenine glycosylase [Candidatus Paceibacterota bacterium]
MKHSDDLFRDIVWTIIGQQLSGKAADTIFDRFASLFPDKKLVAEKILALEESAMRSAGLSGAKARAIRNFSEHVMKGELKLEDFKKLDDVSVTAELTKVKGIGPWTAEMILMFSLGRTDVFSAGDLGLMKGLKELYGLRKLPDKKKVEKLSKAWSPYRTYAARVLWRVADSKKKASGRKKLQK